ncbi:MAG: RNA polymerase sigma-70 factor (ECF subfamily) [Limimaricola cinnabarinus]|jgi:RNA polymerase sigma-70 factor (ECF subfamily)|uniref:sigma-70 family RNA polymerase sigma factor n=1 Tax=Limimaricola cinnabarinus TaxID=1125964 RepID=UPI0039E4386D
MSRLTEIEAMIARIALGDRDAFGALYDATSAKLFGICLRVLSNRAEAEDALQEIYVKVWHNAGRYQVNGLSPMTWLITIARNHAIDRLRMRRKAESRGGDMDAVAAMADTAPGPEALAVAASDSAQIERCLTELEPDRAGAVRGAYLAGDSYADLAARYDVPLNTMRTWLRRSLMRLKECLTR